MHKAWDGLITAITQSYPGRRNSLPLISFYLAYEREATFARLNEQCLFSPPDGKSTVHDPSVVAPLLVSRRPCNLYDHVIW